MAQPNLENLTLHLPEARSELSKVPNLPSVSNNQAILDQFDAVFRRLEEIQSRADEIQRQQESMQTQIVNIENSVSSLDINQIKALISNCLFKLKPCINFRISNIRKID